MIDKNQPISEFKSTSGTKRIFSAFFYSIAGFRAAWAGEHAFRQELMLVVVATVIALILPVSGLEKLMLIGVFILVLIVELLNSAIEAVVDRVSLERNPLSKNAKDFGSAADFPCLHINLRKPGSREILKRRVQVTARPQEHTSSGRGRRVCINPGLVCLQVLLQEFPCRIIYKLTLIIEQICRIADVSFGLLQCRYIEEHQ